MRKSIEPTYDSRQTGPAYHVTYRLNGKPITFQEPIDDPFIRGRVIIGWRDIVRGLLRGYIEFEVLVGGDRDRMNDVLELDANALISHSTRRTEFNAEIQESLEDMNR